MNAKAIAQARHRAKLDQASTYFHWLADRARKRFDMSNADGRMEAFKFLMGHVNRISDKLERAAVANDMAEHLGVDARTGAGAVQENRQSTSGRRGPTSKGATKEPASVPAIEKILLNAVIGSAEVRVEILPQLTADLMTEFATREIFDTLRQMSDADAGITFSGLEARLPPPLQSLLHDMIAADDISDEALSLELARACLRRLESGAMKRRIDELKARVKSAEREGQVEQALAWMAELGRLEQQAKRNGGNSGAAGVVH